jgi:hypothetical protein
VAGGTAWVSAIEFEGQVVIRACLTSGESTEQDVMALVRALVQQVQENSESASL